MNKITDDTTEGTIEKNIKIGIRQYVLIILCFSIPILIVGYYVVKDTVYMMMPLMFVLVYGMRPINYRLR